MHVIYTLVEVTKMKENNLMIAVGAVIALLLLGALGLALFAGEDGGDGMVDDNGAVSITEGDIYGDLDETPQVDNGDPDGLIDTSDLDGSEDPLISPPEEVEVPQEPLPSEDEEGVVIPDEPGQVVDDVGPVEENPQPDEEEPQVVEDPPEEEEVVDPSNVPVDEPEEEGLSDVEIEGLLFMREEEKLARDVYSYLYDLWGQRTFDNIQGAEQKHMDSLLGLIEEYSLEDPVGDNGPGIFEDQALQDLYDDLIESGEASLVDALLVGAAIEEIDILDIQGYISETDDPDIIRVYENLIKGSENHLNAFVNALSKQGVEYEPQYLSQEEYDSIVE